MIASKRAHTQKKLPEIFRQRKSLMNQIEGCLKFHCKRLTLFEGGFYSATNRYNKVVNYRLWTDWRRNFITLARAFDPPVVTRALLLLSLTRIQGRTTLSDPAHPIVSKRNFWRSDLSATLRNGKEDPRTCLSQLLSSFRTRVKSEPLQWVVCGLKAFSLEYLADRNPWKM